MKYLIFMCLLFIPLLTFGQGFVTGKVYEANEKGENPLPGANILWLDTQTGTTSGQDGNFRVPFSPETNKLVISYVGYEADTIIVLSTDQLIKVVLIPTSTETEKVTVTGEKPSMVADYFGIENTSILTKKELFKAACCNLSESFETSAAIDVSFTDAVTGTKQIEMLGLSGIYTQTTMENLPFIRGLISSVGLTFVPGSWINSINLSKGVGSVVNGYESITGQIDVALVKPHAENEEKPLFMNVYGDYDQRLEGNLNYRVEFSEKLAVVNLFHWSNRSHESDLNYDGFMDMPTFNNVNLLQRWQYQSENGWSSQLGFQYVGDQKRGGTTTHDISTGVYFHPDQSYRYENDNRFFNIFAKTGYVFPDAPNKSFGFQITLNNYQNDSKYGLRNYSGLQKNFYFNFIYQSYFEENIHKFKAGTSFNLDDFKEDFSLLNYRRVEKVPGAFFEYTYTPNTEFSMIAGLRGDYHSFYGAMITPRLHFRYAPVEEWVFRGEAGRGYRTANILTENSSSFISSRTLDIVKVNNFGYGLDQEVAWNFGASATYYFLFGFRDASISLDYYHTWFEKVVIPNADTDPQKIQFKSVDNGTYSNSVQAELNIKPLEMADLRLAYRFLDVKQSIDGQWLQRPFTSKHRALINLAIRAYRSDDMEREFLIDLTTQWFGEKRIPSTFQNPVEYRRDDHSPSFILVNAQSTYTFSPQLSLYIGGENLLDFKQGNPIISPLSPSDKYFDASLIWGPVNGRMIYAGVRTSL